MCVMREKEFLYKTLNCMLCLNISYACMCVCVRVSVFGAGGFILPCIDEICFIFLWEGVGVEEVGMGKGI